MYLMGIMRKKGKNECVLVQFQIMAHNLCNGVYLLMGDDGFGPFNKKGKLNVNVQEPSMNSQCKNVN
jgi:hypothetical protein